MGEILGRFCTPGAPIFEAAIGSLHTSQPMLWDAGSIPAASTNFNSKSPLVTGLFVFCVAKITCPKRAPRGI